VFVAAEEQKAPNRYPRLRNLQYSPLKQQDEQYVLFWDPTGLSQDKLIVPLSYFYLFQFFDGEHSLEQIGGEYLRKFGEFLMPDKLEKLVAELGAKLFLEGERTEAARRAAVRAYREAPVRRSVFAGKSYEEDGEKLQLQLESFFASREGPGSKPSENRGKVLKGIVAPHYEVRAGGAIYAWAYKELREAETPDCFVVFGTCHAGLANHFAVTGKAFEMPLGVVPVDADLLDRVRVKSGGVLFEEELSHRHEHSIEFQLPFLQFCLGGRRPFTIVPVLCAFPPRGVTDAGCSAMKDQVETFIGTLREAIAESGRRVCFVGSADLAHIGMRYGDPNPPTDFSFHRCMQNDLAMLKHVENLDPQGFAEFIRKEEDSRRICGFSPIYTMLRVMEATTGQVLRYDRGITDQFNSTVTYASMAFY
jgi:hypothetical protein